jgi:hypothetical protein
MFGISRDLRLAMLCKRIERPTTLIDEHSLLTTPGFTCWLAMKGS